MQDTHRVTRLLRGWGETAEDVLDAAVSVVYEEPFRLAHHRLSRARGIHRKWWKVSLAAVKPDAPFPRAWPAQELGAGAEV